MKKDRKKDKKKKDVFEDDGRTIFDMSAVSRPGLFGHWGGLSEAETEETFAQTSEGRSAHPFENPEGEESRERKSSFRVEGTGEDAVIYDAEEAAPQERSWEQSSLTGADRRAYILGALGATLLIVLAFLIGLGLVILLLLWLWS